MLGPFYMTFSGLTKKQKKTKFLFLSIFNNILKKWPPKIELYLLVFVPISEKKIITKILLWKVP